LIIGLVTLHLIAVCKNLKLEHRVFVPTKLDFFDITIFRCDSKRTPSNVMAKYF